MSVRVRLCDLNLIRINGSIANVKGRGGQHPYSALGGFLWCEGQVTQGVCRLVVERDGDFNDAGVDISTTYFREKSTQIHEIEHHVILDKSVLKVALIGLPDIAFESADVGEQNLKVQWVSISLAYAFPKPKLVNYHTKN